MLEQVLDFVHNYFVKEVHKGSFSISDESLNVDFLQEGQYFKIIGSVFNDGVHKFGTGTLQNETFVGEVWAMAVPPAVIALSDEIDDWIAKYGDQASSPYQSESFGGYSYSKKSSGGQFGDGNAASDWTGIFRSRLNHWRKIS